MKDETKQLIDTCVAASHAGTGNFGEQVAALAREGVESYRVDFRERASSYFGPGDSYRVSIQPPDVPIGGDFDARAIEAAVRGSQQGVVKYPEFMQRAMKAGCVAYVVWIAGRHVAYYGCRGEVHVEHFPS